VGGGRLAPERQDPTVKNMSRSDHCGCLAGSDGVGETWHRSKMVTYWGVALTSTYETWIINVKQI
jgi:hypothetical protein